MLKSMLGPPLTMLLMDGGLLIVSQEIEACILMPANFIEKPVSKKRKIGPSVELSLGEPSERKEAPQICVAMATPAITKPKIIPNIVIDLGNPTRLIQGRERNSKDLECNNGTNNQQECAYKHNGEWYITIIFRTINGHSTEILKHYQLLENWISVTTLSSNGIQHNYTLIIGSENFNPLPQRGISKLQD